MHPWACTTTQSLVRSMEAPASLMSLSAPKRGLPLGFMLESDEDEASADEEEDSDDNLDDAERRVPAQLRRLV